MWAWTRSRSPWFPHVFIAVLRWSSTVAVVSAWLVLLVLLLVLFSFLLSSGPRCSTPWPVRTRRTVFRGLCLDRIAGHDAFASCSLSLSAGPCCRASCTSWTIPGPDSADGVAFPGQVVLARRCATTGAGSGRDSAQLCPWRLTGAALGPGYGHYYWFHAPDSANCLEVPQLQLIFKDIDISSCGAEADPCGAGEIPQLPYSWWSMSLLCSSTSLSRSRGFFSWSRLCVGPQRFTRCLTR